MGSNSRMEITEERTSELEARSISHREKATEKKLEQSQGYERIIPNGLIVTTSEFWKERRKGAVQKKKCLKK